MFYVFVAKPIRFIFLLSSIATNYAHGIPLEEMKAGVSVSSKQTLHFIYTLKGENFAVFKLRSQGTHTDMTIESAESDFAFVLQRPDLYLEQRVFIPPGSCQPCTIMLTTHEYALPTAKIWLDIEEFSISEKQRQQSERYFHTPYTANKESLQIDYQRALENYLAAQDKWKDLSKPRELKNSLFLAGDAASGFGIEQMRPDQFEKLLVLALDSDDWVAASRAETRLGRYDFTQGHYEAAKQHYLQALEYSHKIVDKYLYDFLQGEIYHELGQTALKNNTQEKVDEYLSLSLQNFSKTGAYLQKANVLNTKGLFSRINAESEKNERVALHHERAYQYIANLRDAAPTRMRTLYYLAIVNAIQGRYFYALRMLQESDKTANRLKTVHWLAHIKAAQARVYMELGDLQLSHEFYDETEALYLQVNAKHDLLTLYTNRARLSLLMNDLDSASQYLAKANISKHSDASTRLIDTQASAYLKEGKLEKALKTQLSAIKQARTNGNPREIGRNLSLLSEIYFRLGEYALSRDNLNEAITHHRSAKDNLYIIHSHYLAAQFDYKLKGLPSLIRKNLDIAFEKIEELRTDQLRDDIQQKFLALQKSVYELYINANLSTDGQADTKENAILTLFKAESFKARTLYERIFASSDPTSLLPEAMLRRQKLLATWDEKLISNEMDTGKLIEEALRKQLLPSSQRKKLTVQPITLEHLKDLIENHSNNEATLIFFLGESRSWMWLIKRGQIKLTPLPPRQEIASLVSGYDDILSTSPYRQDQHKLWQSLHQQRHAISTLLFDNISKDLETVEHIRIIPDDVIHKLSFSTLYDLTTMQPFVLSKSISYLPSLATANLLQQKNTLKKDPKSLLLLSHSNEHHVAAGKNAARTQSESLPPLPFVKEEAEQVQKIWQQDSRASVTHLDKQDATKSSWLAAKPQHYEVLHFATHAQVNRHFPALSAVKLARNHAHGGVDDDLTVQEISQLSLAAEMIVLSGCETSDGNRVAGEGPIGLSRAFFAAGGKRIVASLWPVEDKATAYLMKNFYQALILELLAPAEALRHAKLQVASQPNWRHPHYWAGFEFFGNKDHWRE